MVKIGSVDSGGDGSQQVGENLRFFTFSGWLVLGAIAGHRWPLYRWRKTVRAEDKDRDPSAVLPSVATQL
jgi:hypothetical protein